MSDSFYGSGSREGLPPPPAGRLPLHADAYSDRDDTSEASDPRYRPSASPPAGAPPTPPPTPPAWHGKTSSAAQFQADYGATTQQPNGDTNDSAAPNTASFRGDATLRPNVGLTNSYEYALFGWTLQELIVNLRTVNLIATAVTLLFILTSWIGKFFTFQLSQLVLLGYLGVLSLALFLVDIMGFYRTQLSERGITASSTHTFEIEERVRDQLGLLYHPGGKAFYLFFLAVLCGALGDLILRIIALLYLFSAFGYVYAYNVYPEFRRNGGATIRGPSSSRNGARNLWTKQAWTTTSLNNSQGLAQAVARNWSSRWGLGTGPEEDPSEQESFLQYHQANQTYINV